MNPLELILQSLQNQSYNGNPISALQGMNLGQGQSMALGPDFGDMSGRQPIMSPQPNQSGIQSLLANLQAIDGQDPAINISQAPTNSPYVQRQNPYTPNAGGPQLSPAGNSNASRLIQQGVGALPQSEPDRVQNILSGRFNESPNFGTDLGDYAQGVVSSALGKPALGTQFAQQRQAGVDEQLAAMAKMQQSASNGLFAGNGMDAQVYNILSTKDPSSREYQIAYNIASEPKTQVGADGTISVVKPNLSAFAPPGTQAPQQQMPGATNVNVGDASVSYLPSPSTTLKNKVDTEGKLRDDYLTQSKPFIVQRDAYNRIQESAKDPSPAGDLSLIFNYMKVLDPGSTVREGEFATAQNAGSLDSRITAQYNKILNGERLAPAMRADFVKRSQMLYQGATRQQRQNSQTFNNLANKAKVDPTSVAVPLEYIDGSGGQVSNNPFAAELARRQGQ